MNILFHNFLLRLGFSEKEVLEDLVDNTFVHSIEKEQSISVKYIYTPTESDIFNYHQNLWNRNSDSVFVAVSDIRSYLINAKEKPDEDRPLKNTICLRSFEYGINSADFENIDLVLISKNSVDSSYFFDFISKTKRSDQTVDKDLLLNLLTLKNDLLKVGDERTIHLLILRCLFIKYLEDRGIFENNYLQNILKSNSPDELVRAFNEVTKINGDVFKFDQFEVSDIKIEYLNKLALFFESDYRSSQLKLFPYKFDQMPIQLISHVYEAFLKGTAKKGKGIYYTPPFLVNFMLDQSFSEKVNQNPKAKILDPAVGSAAFLVEAFKMIQNAYGKELDFNTKKEILEEQLFGIDVDQNALQIAAFSLYLALLETEDPEFIRDEIKRANPILPSLIGKTLIHGNSITDNIFPDEIFDCIASNPPWGSVPTELNDSYQKEREAIDNKDGHYPEYAHVADYERSQAFLTRVSKWGDKNTLFVMVVKNSIFLNDKTQDFRFDLLNKYQINTFYELSHYNTILFKKSPIGEIDGEKIELGASEPCVVAIFQQKTSQVDNIVKYISPKLTDFSEHFELIHYTNRDKFELKQSEFILKDSLWKVLVNGDIEYHDLIINKLQKQKALIIEARSGFKPQKNMIQLGNPIWKQKIEPTDFEQYYLRNKNLDSFNWNQNLERRRSEEIFVGPRIIVTMRPLKSDNYLFRGIYLEDEIIHKHNILSIKLKNKDTYISNYLPYLGIINSELFGFLFFQLSTQWGKGEGKRDTLRNVDVEKLPLKEIKDKDLASQMTELVKSIQTRKSNNQDCRDELDLLNEFVFELYGLLDYEKEIIKEFYQIRVQRAEAKQSKVKAEDILSYHKAFKETFSLILSKENSLNASYHISSNFGTVICFSIVDNAEAFQLKENRDLKILNFVKSNQLKKSDSLKILFEDKVKIYDKDKFYIIKSNQFKDWTVRQAIRDAKEEIELFIHHLSPTK
ncbi:MAG: SAM-dependent methyltransferase [Prolixibacteraceae bacterium]|nr:SAM-dependent methyltransferase [Prolixibacteraceae bacterium]